MIPGPNYIYKCPNCGNLMARGSMVSGNTFGSKIFSDGRRIAPMLPEFPNLTKCKKCDTIFWLSKIKEIGTVGWGDHENPEWQYVDNVEFLKIDDYFTAIDTGIAESKEEELIIRRKIWWAYNDRKRNDHTMFVDVNDILKWEANIIELINLFDQNDIDQRIVVAELNRNLGDFEKCKSLMESIDDEDLNWLKEKFITECEKKNRNVIELN